jgi:hypothetical protein
MATIIKRGTFHGGDEGANPDRNPLKVSQCARKGREYLTRDRSAD